MATSSVNLASLIYAQSLAQNVPPAIALAVAQQESGISQWTPSGNLVTGTSGEIGVFQLMPATAQGLGVDPTDVDQNISGGISLLSQLYEKYGNWDEALSAYNSGSPTGSPSYAASVLNIASTYGSTDLPSATISTDDSADDSTLSDALGDPNVLLIGGGLAVVLLIWWLA
jgi:soluble lytic murein transglycosylase-like protein